MRLHLSIVPLLLLAGCVDTGASRSSPSDATGGAAGASNSGQTGGRETGGEAGGGGGSGNTDTRSSGGEAGHAGSAGRAGSDGSGGHDETGGRAGCDGDPCCGISGNRELHAAIYPNEDHEDRDNANRVVLAAEAVDDECQITVAARWQGPTPYYLEQVDSGVRLRPVADPACGHFWDYFPDYRYEACWQSVRLTVADGTVAPVAQIRAALTRFTVDVSRSDSWSGEAAVTPDETAPVFGVERYEDHRDYLEQSNYDYDHFVEFPLLDESGWLPEILPWEPLQVWSSEPVPTAAEHMGFVDTTTSHAGWQAFKSVEAPPREWAVWTRLTDWDAVRGRTLGIVAADGLADPAGNPVATDPIAVAVRDVGPAAIRHEFDDPSLGDDDFYVKMGADVGCATGCARGTRIARQVDATDASEVVIRMRTDSEWTSVDIRVVAVDGSFSEDDPSLESRDGWVEIALPAPQSGPLGVDIEIANLESFMSIAAEDTFPPRVEVDWIEAR